jgi:hypothetical protein
MTSRIQLEPEAQAFVEAAAKPPWLFTLGPARGRLAVDEAQSGSVSKQPVDIEDLTIADGPSAQLGLRILRPQNAQTLLHQGFADVANRFPAPGLNTWEVNAMQDLLGKAFPLFSLVEGQTYVDYDLIYLYNDMLFNGSKNVDGRAFDKPENRPTNLQIPLVRQQ